MKALEVFFHHSGDAACLLGKLLYKEGLAYLELDKSFLDMGINISPLNLKLEGNLQLAPRLPFNGLHGVFADSLPDSWGLLLMDRQFRQREIPMGSITPLDRLAYMGNRAMGALSFFPDMGEPADDTAISLNAMAEESIAVYQGNTKEVTKQLNIIGGSPGGARPKVTIGLKGSEAISGAGELPAGYQHWLVKFPTGTSSTEKAEGAVEYVYSLIAQKAGIQFPQTQLIESDLGQGYFACQRFDRGENNQRIHMHTLAGMINADFRVPDADYELLMKATSHVCKSHLDMCEVLRRMIFNILSGNRDDHTKNFSFLMSAEGIWHFSPAYDLTFNIGINGQHSMSVMGHGENIPKKAIQAIADLIPLPETKVNLMIKEVIEALSQWQKLAQEYDVPVSLIKEIDAYIAARAKELK